MGTAPSSAWQRPATERPAIPACSEAITFSRKSLLIGSPTKSRHGSRGRRVRHKQKAQTVGRAAAESSSEDEDDTSDEDGEQTEEGDPTDGKRGVPSPCATNWKAASADEKKCMWGVFDETGIFASACQHGLVLWIADMIRSGELCVHEIKHYLLPGTGY